MQKIKIAVCNARCRKCVYSVRDGATLNRYNCVYILITGRPRPCPAGRDCTEFKRRKKKDVQEKN